METKESKNSLTKKIEKTLEDLYKHNVFVAYGAASPDPKIDNRITRLEHLLKIIKEGNVLLPDLMNIVDDYVGEGKKRPKRARKPRARKQLVRKPRVKKGKGITNWLINKLPLELHYISPFYGKHNFTGPGTNLNVRLNKDGTPKEWSIPKNRVDRAAMIHDIDYGDHDYKNRKVYDTKMINTLDEIIADKNAPFGEKFDARVVGAVMKTKRFFGLGKSKKGRGEKMVISKPIVKGKGRVGNSYASNRGVAVF